MADRTISAKKAIEHFRTKFADIRKEIGKFIVGQEEVVEHVLIAVVCGGHVLLEGVPGLGKTALVQTISKTLHLDFKRIQFTPDLLPADVVGSNILVEKKGREGLSVRTRPGVLQHPAGG